MEGHVVAEAPRIVVFGKNGQVGHRLMETLTTAGFEVTGHDRTSCNLDTITVKELFSLINAVEPALVINATAYTGVDAAETDAAAPKRLNEDIPALMAAICAEQHVPFVHFSTDYVFDGHRGAPYSETAPTNPVNRYAITKLAGEQAALKAGGHVFRLQWVFDSRGKNFFLTMKKLLAEREEVKVVADQIGTPSNALHIAKAIADAAPKIIDKTLPAGLYHLSAGGHASWHQFACAIAQATGARALVTPIVTSEYPLPAARPKDSRLNTAKLASYGIAMPHWREGLAQAVKDGEYSSPRGGG